MRERYPLLSMQRSEPPLSLATRRAMYALRIKTVYADPRARLRAARLDACIEGDRAGRRCKSLPGSRMQCVGPSADVADGPIRASL